MGNIQLKRTLFCSSVLFLKAKGWCSVGRSTALLLCLLSSFCLQAQYYLITGKIFDNADKLVLPNAHVAVVGGKGVGAIADENGFYKIAVDKPEVELTFKYIGYSDLTKKISFGSRKLMRLDIAMTQETHLLQEAVVTRQRYRADKITNPQTLEVIGIKQIERENAMTLDKALGSVPGLTIVDNEPQMRGGSGFSSGMGSRVMILLDEMPILRSDAGRPAWNLIPMEDVAQIEVIKGASSVMYGSAAINGAINVRTQFAKDEPQTKINLYGGAYSKPQASYKSPWTSGLPLKMGLSASHSRKINKIDLTMGIEYSDDDGYRGIEKRLPDPTKGQERGDEDMSLHAERRFRANVGLNYRISSQWSASLGANYMNSDNNQSHFWYNAKESIYNTYPGTLSHFNDIMFFVDPQVKYIDNNGGTHTLKNRILFSDNKVLNHDAQDASSRTIYNAYNYKKLLNETWNWNLNAGFSNTNAYSTGTVFSGDAFNIGSAGVHTGNNAAFFARTEVDFLKRRNLTLNFGARWEFSAVDQWKENRPIFQFGANFFIPTTYTYFRANIGQGYRAATIGERFITTRIGEYGFYPNPDLKSETSINTEVAVKQMFKVLGFQGFVDVALFHQQYDNYIEFCMGPFNPNPLTSKDRFGFRFFNTGAATIKGVEANIAGEGSIGPYFSYQLNLGYTYSLPQAVDPNYVYYSDNSGSKYSLQTYSNNPANNILKYRIQHVGKADLNFIFIKRLTIGFSAKYFSSMKNMDKPFYEFDGITFPFYGMKEFYNRTWNGAWVFDVRAAIDFDKFNVAVICNNLLNTEYSLRPLHVESTRLLTLAVSYRFSDINPGKFFRKTKYKEETRRSNQNAVLNYLSKM